MSDNYQEEIYEIDIETGSILQTMDHWSIDQTRGIDFEKNADGTTSDYFYALEDRGGTVQVVKNGFNNRLICYREFYRL